MRLLLTLLLTTTFAQPTGKPGEIPPSLSSLRPSDFYTTELVYRHTGFGSRGCDDVFRGGMTLVLSAQAFDNEPAVEMHVSAFAFNGTKCDADQHGMYEVSAKLPGTKDVFGAHGAPRFVTTNKLLQMLFFFSREKKRSVACQGGGLARSVVLGDMVEVMYSEKKVSILTADPRQKDFTFNANTRYVMASVGFEKEIDNLCVLTAGKWSDEEDEGGKEDDKRRRALDEGSDQEMPTLAVVGIVLGCIATVVLLALLLAVMHLRS